MLTGTDSTFTWHGISCSVFKALQLRLAKFMKWMGWIHSPDGDFTICSSSAAFLQLNPSAANSMVLRAAFWYSSLAELQIRCRTKLGYSVRIGMGMTATSLWRDTRRCDLVFLNIELQLVWEVSVKVPRDVCRMGRNETCQRLLDKWTKFWTRPSKHYCE